MSLVESLGSSRELLRVYGVPALLNQLGVFELSISDTESFTWDFGGMYEVKVNGGGLVTEVPLEPLRELIVKVEFLDSELLASSIASFTGSESYPGILNPLGWRPLAPAFIDSDLGLPGCIETSYGPAGSLNIEPLHTSAATSCTRPSRSPGVFKARFGVFELSIEGDVGRVGFNSVVESWDLVAVGTMQAATLRSHSVSEVTISHPYRDYYVSLLHVLSFYRFNGEGSFKGLAAVIEGPRGSLAIASPQGFELTALKGLVKLRFKGELSIASGGYVEASRLLLERCIRWAAARSTPKPIGHVRSYRALPVLTLFEDGVARFNIANPTMADGSIEVKTYYPLVEARFTTLGETMEVRAARDSITLPAPRGYCGFLEVKVRKPF